MIESLCFLPSVSLRFPIQTLNYRLDKNNKSSTPRSVLEQPRQDPRTTTRPVTPPKCPFHSETPHLHVAYLPAGVSAANFRAYPEGFPEDASFIPPPPVHYTVPGIGYAVENSWGIIPRDRARKHGDVYTMDFFGRRMHFICDWTAIHELIRDNSTFINNGANPVVITMFGEDAMINLDGFEHQDVREKMAPALSPRLFPFYAERIRIRAENSWRQMAEQTTHRGGKGYLETMIRELFLAATIEVTNGIGLKSEEYTELSELYYTFLKALFTPKFMLGWKKAFQAKQKILDIVEKLIRRMLVDDADVINDLRKYGDRISVKGGRDILKGRVSISHIMIANAPFVNVGPNAENNPEDIAYQAKISLGLWFAGMTTASSTISCALFEMGFDKSIWNSLTIEQDTIVEESQGNRTVKFDQLNNMPLLDSFLTEIMRVHPASIGTAKKTAQDFEVFGKKIEKNSYVWFDHLAAHMDERYYPEPEKIIVDRFLNRATPSILTFGVKGSAHYCLGSGLSKVLMKTTLSILLREYTMEMDQAQSRKYKFLPDNVPESKVVITELKPRF